MKIKHLAYMSAIALVSMSVLSSCEKKDSKDNNDVNGNYNGEQVKSEFSIALPSQAVGSNGARRMPSTTVQKNGRSEFQGMKDITLIPFATQGKIQGTDSRLGANIALTPGIGSASELGTNSNAKVYPSVSIPLTTASFLFYAESAASGNKENTGVLTASLDHNNPQDITFDLEVIQSSNTNVTAAGSKGKALLDYLNAVANANDGETTPTAWKDYTTTMHEGMTALFETYATTMHGLSSFKVQSMMEDLYNSLAPLRSANTLAANVMTAIETQANVTGSAAPYTLALKEGLAGFPQNVKLPDGAVGVKWNATSKAFEFDNASYNMESGSGTLVMGTFNNFTYPASLWYYANSQISTSNTSQRAKYDDSNNWSTILGYHTDAKAVNSLTRAVAIDDVVQYAVARLDVMVRLQSGSLADNNTVDETPATIDCASYPITGVLVGGQKGVGYDFTPNGSQEYTIYDQVMTEGSSMAATADAFSASTPTNSTLVLETAAGTGKDVMIAVEMTNASGKDFYGVNGQLIPAGGTFYVVAKLEATAATDTDQKVFKQDYTTTAKLTLKSLKNAYNTIPDLRTPQLELGFSVDLTWQTGHTFEIDVL